MDNGVHVLIHGDESPNDAIARHFAGGDKEHKPNAIYKNESIHISKTPTAEHVKSGEHAAKEFGMNRDFAIEQARKADDIRSKVEPVTQRTVNELTQEFPKAQVSGRLKDRSQMVDKLGRKPDTYKDVSDLKDVSGVRVVSGQGIDDVKKIGSEIESKYNVIEKPENYIDNPVAGYRSLHYTVQDPDSKVISEVQVRTVNEDKWATYSHDKLYKVSGKDKEILDANKGEVNDYMLGMSNYYYELDSGKRSASRPPCPKSIQRLIGCM